MFRILYDTLYPRYILALSLLYVRNIPLIRRKTHHLVLQHRYNSSTVYFAGAPGWALIPIKKPAPTNSERAF